MKLLLTKNELWNDNAHDYRSRIVTDCRACLATLLPQHSRWVSPSSLIRPYDDVVSIDHVFLGDHKAAHIMCSKLWLSALGICDDMSLMTVIYPLQTSWL